MWKVYVHEDDPRYLSINGGGNDTLLRTSEGHLDQARAAEFAEWVTALREQATATLAAAREAEVPLVLAEALIALREAVSGGK